MKNILKYILCFAFCVGVIFATITTINAEENENIYCSKAFETGDEIVYYMSYSSPSGTIYSCSINYIVQSETDRYRLSCLYYKDSDSSASGKAITFYDINDDGKVNDLPPAVDEDGDSRTFIAPLAYRSNLSSTLKTYTDVSFYTNIPIFEDEATAISYVNGEVGIENALNYKKIHDNGSWVKPFEDIEINDSNMSSPQLANVSHRGFTVINVPDDRYMVDVYLESGIQNPLPYEISLTSIGDALFVNSFGLVSDTEGAFTGEIDLLSCYGVDNVSALNSSVEQFYSTYPSINAFNDSLPMDTLKINKLTWSIWGQPFGKSFVFFTKSTSATGTVSADNCPLAYTNYKVRYFYYDDDSGFHYGPWTNFIYFSDGRVMRGEVFQGNDGNIIETPLENGTQDSNGNVSIQPGSLIDLENPNQLFGYLRSLINNINVTGNNFMTLFGTVFSFLPADLLAIIWLGIGIMILVGIIRAFN